MYCILEPGAKTDKRCVGEKQAEERKGMQKINSTFSNQKHESENHDYKTMLDLLYKCYKGSKSSEVCLHSAYSPARAQFMFIMEVVFLYQWWGQPALMQQAMEILLRMKAMGNRAIIELED